MDGSIGWRRARVLAVVSLIVAAGCGGEDVIVSATLPPVPSGPSMPSTAPVTSVGPASALFEDPTTTLTEGTPTTPGPTDTTAPATVVTTAAPNPCDAEPGLPGESVEIRELTADLEGDGVPDLLRTYGMPTADGPMRWRARLDTGSGITSDLELDDAFAPVEPVGVVQVDRNLGSGVGLGDEVLLAVGTVDAAIAVQVLTVDDSGCLVRMGDGLGAVTTFPIGTRGAGRDGLRCESTDGVEYVVALRATTTGDGTSSATTDTRMQRIGTNLVPFTITDGTASADGAVLPRYSMVDCGGIALPAPP